MNRLILMVSFSLFSSLVFADEECVSKDDKKPEMKLIMEQVDPIIIKTKASKSSPELYYAVVRERGQKIEAKYIGSRKNSLEFLKLDTDPKKGLLYHRKKSGDELQVINGSTTRILSCQLKI